MYIRILTIQGVGSRKPSVLIVTENLLFGQQVRENLVRLGLKPYTLPLDMTPPPTVKVVVTTPDERCRVRFDPQNVVSSLNPKSAARAALELIDSPPQALPLTVGIDPGPRPGVAVLMKGEVAAAYQVPLDDVLPLLKRLVGYRKPGEYTIRLGDGSPLEGNRISNSLLNDGLQCEIVDESGTTPAPGTGDFHHGERDIAAAIAIARKPGEPALFEKVEPTDGEIRQVQAESRRLSGGRVTIPRRLAYRVALGELSLDDALRLQAKLREDDDNT